LDFAKMMKITIALFLISLCYAAAPPKVEVDFYVMSKCPYAANFVQNFQQTVFSQTGLSDILQITMNYIASVDPTEPTGFYSKHGQSEVYGDFTELCVDTLTKSNADPFIWWKFVVCLDNNYGDIPDNVQSCASSLGLDYNVIQKCVNSTISSNLLKHSINITNSLGWNPRPGSPTVYVNKQCIYGLSPCTELDPSGNQVLQYICSLYTGTKPAGCNWIDYCEKVV